MRPPGSRRAAPLRYLPTPVASSRRSCSKVSLPVLLELNHDDFDRLRGLVHVRVRFSRWIHTQPVRLPFLPVVGVDQLAVLIDHLELAVGERDQRSAVLMTMLGQRGV